MQREHPLVELPWRLLLLALCRRTLGSERHRRAIAWPDKLGTGPMANVWRYKWTPPRKSGETPWMSKHQIQPEYNMENEKADAGWDGRTRLARPNAQARTGTGKCPFSLFSWPRAGSATLPGWSLPLPCCMWWPYNIHSIDIYSVVFTCQLVVLSCLWSITELYSRQILWEDCVARFY